MKAFQPVCIERPEWAREPDLWLDRIRLRDYQLLQSHRSSILKLVQNEVTQYLNTDDLVFFDPADGFPVLPRMTGEYYISDESYMGHVGPCWYEIRIQTHFLERQWMDGQTDFDYLGLEVCLRYDPKEDELESLVINSSAI